MAEGQRPPLAEFLDVYSLSKAKAMVGATPFFFVPGTLWRTWATRPGF
jgi:hypothetical protein